MTSLHCNDASLHCNDASLHCNDASLLCNDASLHCIMIILTHVELQKYIYIC